MRSITALCFSLGLSLSTLACTDDGSPGDGASADDHAGWRDLPAIAGGPRQEHGVVALDGKVYVIAGAGGDGLNTGRVEVYDPGAVAVDGAIYVPGGGTQQGFGLTDVSEAFSP
ncbi:hypothetical protein WME91_19310 [Sorangium sp. So ce269]